ncbi:hypothetical protein GQF61_13380 [Sphingobacterium sp. DK4209]|uniref:hypothetical protein n=1 Tax=Sphingobacterium zhuxiongii TaxID=2662364 RepID=UPI001295FEBC|nr:MULTISPECIES: hypothetical protein [unclassified Sphingobacterium]MVZ66848.1 hypothetical protein [Sphingobacterium sp. DK4209]
MFNKKPYGLNSSNSTGHSHPFIKSIKKVAMSDKPKFLWKEILEHLQRHKFEFSNN